MSRMNWVGECVWRAIAGLSEPACERTPPSTSFAGESAFSASYDFASSETYETAATSSPFGPNCGSQKRFRFGSLPMMKCFACGTALAIATTQAVKSPWSWSESGVTELPNG